MKGPRKSNGLSILLPTRKLRTLLLGIGLLILTNAIVLAGVAYNRSGTPESSITLTERELGLPYYYRPIEENSGISLRINIRNKGSYSFYREEPNWLTHEKLAELGFDVTPPVDNADDWSHIKRQKEREVILVLEYNGAAYQAAINAAQQKLDELRAEAQSKSGKEKENCDCKQAESDLQREQIAASRLFIIDAGLNQEALRKKYPDNTKYLFLKGVAGVYVDIVTNTTHTYNGYIKSLSISEINIPLEYHDILQPALEDDKRGSYDHPPRYQVKLNIGQRLEPWVVEIKQL